MLQVVGVTVLTDALVSHCASKQATAPALSALTSAQNRGKESRGFSRQSWRARFSPAAQAPAELANARTGSVVIATFEAAPRAG